MLLCTLIVISEYLLLANYLSPVVLHEKSYICLYPQNAMSAHKHMDVDDSQTTDDLSHE